MQRVMHNNAGVYRNGKFLKDGCDQISKLAADMEKNLKVHDHSASYEQTLYMYTCMSIPIL